MATEQGERRPDAGHGGTIAAFCPRCRAVLCTVAPDGCVLIRYRKRRYRFRAEAVAVQCECGAEWRVEVRRKEREPVPP